MGMGSPLQGDAGDGPVLRRARASIVGGQGKFRYEMPTS